ncbi:MAG TPA: MFS transporter [Planctomycetota bacterium]
MADAGVPITKPDHRGSKLHIGAWVLYDLANTVYSATLTYLLTPFAIEALGRERTPLGLVQTASMLLAGILVPVFGAIVDQTARTRRYLTVATLLCIACTAGFGLDFGTAWLLGCFFVANLTYNLGLLFYNALLPAVAAPGREGRISGIGVGLGYIGTLVVLVVLLGPTIDDRTKFMLAAAMFLVAASPCMLLVRDQRPPRAGTSAAAIRAALSQLGSTLRELPRHRALLWFLLGNFCLVDVLNTAILFFADFTKDVFRAAAHVHCLDWSGGNSMLVSLGDTFAQIDVAKGTRTVLDAPHLFGLQFLGEEGLTNLLKIAGLVLNALALPFGILLGPWTDRAPLAVMRTCAVALLGALVGGTVFGGSSVLGYLVTLAALGAFGLAGIWTAGRKMVVLLAPPERVGEFFGLYGITVKLSVVGSALYAIVADAYGCKPAMLAQGILLLLGLGCLAMVRIPARPQATPTA